ncbi:MAG TPA: hypothetical protein VMT85_22200, partial [Thermoanaerobaculia bacterium]|nr:hypothetical protein [Thermoanaerobaculia bacterium]
ETRQAAERARLVAELREIADRHAVEGRTRRVPNDQDCGEVGSVYSENGGEQCVVTHKTEQACDIFCVPIVEPQDPSPAEPNP